MLEKATREFLSMTITQQIAYLEKWLSKDIEREESDREIRQYYFTLVGEPMNREEVIQTALELLGA